MADEKQPQKKAPGAALEHFLYRENEEMLARFESLLGEDQVMREEHYEHPDPARRRLRVACNGCETPWCCNQRVEVDLAEAMVIYRWALTSGKRQLEEALRRARESARAKRPDDTEFFRRRIPCPFLVRGRCSVYALRPHACRTHYMAAHPMKCRDELAPSETYAMDPDPTLIAELDQIAEDVMFFSLIEQTGPLELAEALLVVHRLLTEAKWTAPRKIP